MYKLVGFKKYDFVKDNQKIKGVRLFVEDDVPTKNMFGVCPEIVSVSERILTACGISTLFETDEIIGCMLRISYNKYGKVEEVHVCDFEE